MEGVIRLIHFTSIAKKYYCLVSVEFMDFFIISFPRSGSSLLRLILNTHPVVCVPPESSFLTYFASHYKGPMTREEMKELAAKIVSARKFEHWEMNIRDISRAMGNCEDGASYSQIVRSIYQEYCSSKRVLGDKNNVNWRHLPELQRLYPKARRVLLLRQPASVYASLKAIRGLEGIKYAPAIPKDVKSFVADYMDMIGVFRDEILSETNTNHIVTYEALVKNPSKELGRISEFLHLEAIFDHREFFSKQVEPEDLIPWKEMTRRPITTDGIDSWRKVLDANESAQLHEVQSKYKALIASLEDGQNPP